MGLSHVLDIVQRGENESRRGDGDWGGTRRCGSHKIGETYCDTGRRFCPLKLKSHFFARVSREHVCERAWGKIWMKK